MDVRNVGMVGDGPVGSGDDDVPVGRKSEGQNGSGGKSGVRQRRVLLGGGGMERRWRGTKSLEGKDGACMMVSCEDYGKDVDDVSANACAWRCSVFGRNETQKHG